MSTPQASVKSPMFPTADKGDLPKAATAGNTVSAAYAVAQQLVNPVLYIALIIVALLASLEQFDAAGAVLLLVFGRLFFHIVRAVGGQRCFYAEEARYSLFNRTRKLNLWLSLGSFALAAAIAGLFILQGVEVIPALATLGVVAIVSIPLSLPSAIAAAYMSLMRRLKAAGVEVRHPHALERMATTTTIFTDKTGFLTLNNQTAQVVWVPSSKSRKTKNADGEHVLLKGVSFDSSKRRLMRRLAMVGVLCNEAKIVSGRPTGEGIDTALMRFGTRMMLNHDQLLRHFPRVGQLPFTALKQYAASFHTHKGKTLAAVKGAPEAVAHLCGYTDEKPAPWLQEVKNLADGGYEVLAFAGGPVKGTEYSDLQNLEFQGLVAFVDPPRGDVANAVGQCRVAGVDVKMITGDHPYTALNVAKELGIAARMDEVITGPQLHELNPKGDKFAACVAQAKVFARISPMQKQQIIEAAVAMGDRVIATGSKRDDLPALAQAHIAVATGQKGVDLARNAADVVITNDTFSSLADALLSARASLANSRKTATFMVGFGLGLMVLFAACAALGLAMPLTVMQLVWLQLLTLGAAYKLYMHEPTEKALTRKHPYQPREYVLNRATMIQAVLNGLFVGGATAYSYMFSMNQLAYTHTQACAAALLVLVIAQSMFMLSCRTRFSLAFSKGLFKNGWLWLVVVGSFVIHVGAMYIGPSQEVLQIHAPTLMIWQHMAVYAVIAFCFMEAVKMVVRKV